MPTTAATEPFITMLNNHKGIIFKVANAYCKNEENRKDLIQEIILQLWLAFPKYHPQFAISTWLYRIALNVSISFYRKENRRREINQGIPADIIIWENEEYDTTQHTQLNTLKTFISTLPELDKALMILYLDEKPHLEIARILGISPSNVSTKINRLKEKLKQKFNTIK
jgi:RNA polymerase sigma-70 factor (ECF subfamily)